jgi:hypothetical protein
MPEELAADGRCQSSITRALAVANDCRNVRNGAYSAESKKSRTACLSGNLRMTPSAGLWSRSTGIGSAFRAMGTPGPRQSRQVMPSTAKGVPLENWVVPSDVRSLCDVIGLAVAG